MLWYKAWRESRGRFLIAVAVVIGVCSAVILFQDLLRAQMGAQAPPLNTYTGYLYRRIYAGFLRGTFLVLALVLGLGGLARERAQGTIGFTLALPVSRARWMLSRAFIGLAEIAVLSLLPVLLVPGLSALARQAFPVSQALEFSLLWLGVGSAVFAAAFLVSAIFLNEYTALTVSLIAFYVYPLLVTRIPALRGYPLHIHYIMNGTGMPYFDPHTARLVGPLPWTILSVVALVTASLVALAVRVTEARDLA